MITVLEKRSEVREATRRLRSKIRSSSSEGGQITMGYQGGRLTEKGWWLAQAGFWASFREREDSYWNAFGLEYPFEGDGQVEIAVEANPPKQGIKRRFGGVFGRDDKGKLYLLHRGSVGGGRPGVGKTGFLRFISEKLALTPVQDGDQTTELILVAKLEGSRMEEHLAGFISLAKSYKEQAVAARNTSEDLDASFTPEFTGSYVVPARSSTYVDRDHGSVVRRLTERLLSRGLRVGNDEPRDVFVLNSEGGGPPFVR